MQNFKNRKLIIKRPLRVLLSRYNLTELKNIDVNDRDLIRYLTNKIGKNIIITDRWGKRRIFIVGVYSSAFLQKLINKFLNKNSHKLFFSK